MTNGTLSLKDHYQEALTRASTARAALAQEVEEAYLCRRPSHFLTDLSVGRLCLIASLYKDILDGKGIGDDHNVLSQPHFEAFSTLDIIHLLEGNEEHSPGMATLDLSGYGTVMPTRQGWQVSITDAYGESEVYPLTAESLHTMLLCEGNTTQLVPFFAQGVLPGEDWRPHLDGMSVVVVPQTVPLLDGDVCEIKRRVRLSMHYERYAALVWSVAYKRYGLSDFKRHHVATLTCFGESRIPQNALEAQYWMDVLTYQGWSEEERQRCFLPGYQFSHLTKEAMCDITLYQSLVERREKIARGL